MITDIMVYSLFGYLLGSILFAKAYSTLFHTSDITINSKDHNPGVANAFKNGGTACGMFTLIGDIFKGFIPVYLYCHNCWHASYSIGIAIVMAAPVLGHLFPIWYHFKGGKGIAVSFGSLLGLVPVWQPVLTLAALFIFFSVCVVIQPHYYRTIVTYVIFIILSLFMEGNIYICFGSVLVGSSIVFKMMLSPETEQQFEVRTLWKR